MNTSGYYLDTNTLNFLGASRRTSPFVRENCRIPSAVLHEARKLPEIADLRHLEDPVTVEVLEKLLLVMSTVQPGEFDLIDLYHNRGNADPLLVAHALAANELDDQMLFGVTWGIATADEGLRRCAERFDIYVIGHEELAEMVSRYDAGTPDAH